MHTLHALWRIREDPLRWRGHPFLPEILSWLCISDRSVSTVCSLSFSLVSVFLLRASLRSEVHLSEVWKCSLTDTQPMRAGFYMNAAGDEEIQYWDDGVTSQNCKWVSNSSSGGSGFENQLKITSFCSRFKSGCKHYSMVYVHIYENRRMWFRNTLQFKSLIKKILCSQRLHLFD